MVLVIRKNIYITLGDHVNDFQIAESVEEKSELKTRISGLVNVNLIQFLIDVVQMF